MATRSKHDIEMHERLVRVEERLDSHVKREDKSMEEVVEKLDTIELELSRYRGFIGGVLLMVTAIVTFLKMFGADIKEFFIG